MLINDSSVIRPKSFNQLFAPVAEHPIATDSRSAVAEKAAGLGHVL